MPLTSPAAKSKAGAGPRLIQNGKALILDEPTAALDPIAESNIYAEYNKMAAGRTAVFILPPAGQHTLLRPVFFSKTAGLRNPAPMRS